jgi:hypothetical protein
MSRNKISVIWLSALVCLMVLAARTRGGDSKTFVGTIADSQCALNVHSLSQSHQEMMQMKPEIKSNVDCARFCVKERGGKYVLQSKDKVYKLDAQSLAEQWVGEKVKVVGKLDDKTGMIAVESMGPQVAPASHHAAASRAH